MTYPDTGRPRVHLEVGQVHIALSPTSVWTVLGSCVAVILFVPRTRVSAICHAQLPKPSRSVVLCSEGCPHPCLRQVRNDQKLTYVTCSVEYMVSKLARLGVSPLEVVATILGGSNLFTGTDSERSVGTQNIMTARQSLEAHRFPRWTEQVGGTRGRTVTYLSDTGEINIRYHGGNVLTGRAR